MKFKVGDITYIELKSRPLDFNADYIYHIKDEFTHFREIQSGTFWHSAGEYTLYTDIFQEPSKRIKK